MRNQDNSRTARALIAVIPLLLVNAVAFTGQLAFLRAHLPWPVAGQVAMACALESVAIFLAYHAHVAALADDSALRLRLASYGFAAVIGAMNYSHYAAPGWRPTFPAVAVGLMSASSPWLWAVHSRRMSRDQLKERGLIEAHALRLGSTRWMWHPLRSARVMYRATWAGVADPREAITGWTTSRAQAGHGPATATAARQPAASVASHDTLALPSGDVRQTPRRRATSRSSRKRQSRDSAADIEARALTELARQPDLSGAELGRLIGASPRTGQRLALRLNGRGGDNGMNGQGRTASE